MGFLVISISIKILAILDHYVEDQWTDVLVRCRLNCSWNIAANTRILIRIHDPTVYESNIKTCSVQITLKLEISNKFDEDAHTYRILEKKEIKTMIEVKKSGWICMAL